LNVLGEEQAAGLPSADAPLTSIIIPTRDRAHMLPRALASALGQEDVQVEVVVIDDGSVDETPRLLRKIADADPRLVIVRHDSPRGLPRARNGGIERARGIWIAFLDDDDVWAPRKLRLQLDALVAAGASFAYGSAVIVNELGKAIYVYPLPEPDDLLPLLLQGNVIPAGSSNVIASTDVVRALGGFEESLPGLADWDLWIRLSASAPAAACSEILVGYLQHRGNMSGGRGREAMKEFDLIEQRYRHLATREGVRSDRRRMRRWIDDELRRTLLMTDRRITNPTGGARSKLRVPFRRLLRMGSARRTPAPSRVPNPVWLNLYHWS